MKKQPTENIKAASAVNMVLPAIGIGLMLYYNNICDKSCSGLKGTLLGVDLEIVGIIFMAALFIMAMPFICRSFGSACHLRTMMLSGGIGGEIILIQFQVMKDTYCPFCLAFGTCIFILFTLNFRSMNRWLAFGAFLAVLGVFALFFNGNVLPLYR